MMRRVRLVSFCVVVFVVATVHLTAKRASRSDTSSWGVGKEDSPELVKEKKRKNVIFLIADDMRAQLGNYQEGDGPFNSPRIHTPHLDQLARRSILLTNTFVQFGLCAPSRASILTGRRPDSTKVYDNFHYWRDKGGDFATIPQYFKDNGYHTVGVGKVFHLGDASPDDDPVSWSAKPRKVPNNEKKHMTPERWKAVGEEEEQEFPLQDTLHTQLAKSLLSDLAPDARSGKQNFFLAMGFKKPHAGYICPEKYFSHYDLEETGQYLKLEESQTCVVPDGKLRDYRRAYYACISYVDDLVGDLVAHVARLGLDNNTIISFVSDHGYNFGDHGTFGKRYLYDTITKVPMMVHVPGLTDRARGIRSDSLVESIDLFSSLVDFAELPKLPSCQKKSQTNCTDGKSFRKLVENPDKSHKNEAFTQNSLNRKGTSMRYSIRTERFRFTKTVKIEKDESSQPKSWSDDEEFNRDLYDHKTDPGEHHNRVKSERYADTLDNLNVRLNQYINESLLDQ